MKGGGVAGELEERGYSSASEKGVGEKCGGL